ncbi:MAG: hypothetical protein E6J90_16115, partial [Deltaproteobacteria bacterium]
MRGQAGDPAAVAQAVIDAAPAILDLRDSCVPAGSRRSARWRGRGAGTLTAACDRQLGDVELERDAPRARGGR